MFKKILFATDGSDVSQKAMAYVVDLGKRFNAEILILNAYYLPERFNAHESSHYFYLKKVEENMVNHAKNLLEKLKKELEEKDIRVQTLLVKSPPGPGIIAKAQEENCDLIVTGSRGLGNITSLLINSVSNYVIHHAKCPVLLIN